MMRLTVNEKELAGLPRDLGTVEALLDTLRDRGDIGRDQVVVGLEVDRCRWRAEDMDRMGSARLDGVQEVSVATTDMRGYARRILTDAEGMLGVLKEGARRVAQGLRETSPKEANTHLFNLLNALQRFLSCLLHVQNACELEHGLLAPQGVELEEVSSSLEAVLSSQEQMDWEALARHLEQSFLPALDRVEGVIEEMKGEL